MTAARSGAVNAMCTSRDAVARVHRADPEVREVDAVADDRAEIEDAPPADRREHGVVERGCRVEVLALDGKVVEHAAIIGRGHIADHAVDYELDGHVATITYNRPDALNAINGEMRRDLNDAFARFRDDEDAWVAIVTGAGRAFCAGADMRDGARLGRRVRRARSGRSRRINSFESGWEIFKPVIAAVNGYCLGYGLTLVTWCDFVIASERAEFGFPEVAHRRADDRRRDPAPAAHQLAVRDGAAAHR